jgi:hypothetical protein
MTNALALDLEKLQARAFDRAEWAEDVLRHYHAVMPNLDKAAAHPFGADRYEPAYKCNRTEFYGKRHHK